MRRQTPRYSQKQRTYLPSATVHTSAGLDCQNRDRQRGSRTQAQRALMKHKRSRECCFGLHIPCKLSVSLLVLCLCIIMHGHYLSTMAGFLQGPKGCLTCLRTRMDVMERPKPAGLPYASTLVAQVVSARASNEIYVACQHSTQTLRRDSSSKTATLPPPPERRPTNTNAHMNIVLSLTLNRCQHTCASLLVHSNVLLMHLDPHDRRAAPLP